MALAYGACFQENAELKLSALEHLDRHGNVSATAEEFGEDRKQIRMWRANRDVLLQHEPGREKRTLKLHPGRAVKSEELEVRLFEFLQEERSEGRVVRKKDVQRNAREIRAGVNLQDFDASNMCLQR